MTRRSVATSNAAAAALLTVAVAFSAPTPGEAHKAITSKYTFNEDLFPLFREHCGRCHVDGGVAPMSLLTHDDAAPWAESLRLELLSEDPPKPWHVFALTAREFDTILVWVNGGTPRGAAANAPPPVTLATDWAEGPPDVALKMPAPFTLPGPDNQAAHEVTIAAPAAAGKVLRAVDVLPGTPAIVRLVELSLRTADGATQPLGTWLPGQPRAVPLKAPVTVAKGASIVARFDYQRTWKYEGQPMTDASSIGLYFAAPRTAARRN